MTDEKKGYSVKDRRRFDAEGQERVGAESVSHGPQPGAPPSGPAARGGPVPRPPPAAAPRAPEGVAPKGEPGARGGEAPRPSEARRAAGMRGEPVDFPSFVLSLATNAMISLQGGSQDERIPGRPNLAAAAQHIDILTMLVEKTRGNLTQEEHELLANVLYDLRMNYIAVAQHLEGSTGR